MSRVTRFWIRAAVLGWLGCWLIAGWPNQASAAPPEKMLPENTIFMVKINDAKIFRQAFMATQYGQLWNDPGMKDFRSELLARLDERTKQIKDVLGLSLAELVELPQGALALAAIQRDDPKLPVAGILIAELGENEKKLLDLLDRGAKKAEQEGFKVTTEEDGGLTYHILIPPEEKEAPNEEEKDKPATRTPAPPAVWTHSGGLFLVGSDLAVLKDVAHHRDGREKSLADSESFIKTQAKTESNSAHAIWFLDVNRLIKVAVHANSKGDDAAAQQTELQLNEMGADGLKAIGGCITMGSGSYDTLTKTFVLAPKPVSGILKMFSLPPINIRPESWVPATVASYQTVSFDLDNMYTALNDLVNKFQPNMLQILEQQLVGPNGGPPLSLQQDVFGPLGDRISIISDFKKPIKEDSQRTLIAIALEDTKAFQSTFSRILELAQANPKKREFQGTTIYDFPIPEAANMPGGAPVQAMKGPISVAIVKDAVLVTTDGSLLEQILRPGDAPLAESTAYQTVAREIPERASGMTFVRPDEQARLTYDVIKNGQFEKALQAASQGSGRELAELFSKLIPVEKMPEFAVFAKYLTLGGSYSVMDDDGFLMTGFMLRRTNP